MDHISSVIPAAIAGVTCIVRDGVLHREAPVGTNREGHGGLAGRRIVGGA
jgi:hypothetical protein